MNKNRRIVESKWYGKITEEHKTYTSGAVLVWTGYHFIGYFGVGGKGCENEDTEYIASWGNKMSKKVAIALFDTTEVLSNGEEKSLKDNYRKDV